MKKEINPIPVIVVAVLAVIVAGYFFFIRPGQVNAKIEKEWTTDQAAAQRGPGRPKDEAHEKLVEQLRAKENSSHQVTSHRRDRD